jgi:hypothetical protein
MADIKDISTSIASALNEVGVNGTLDVEGDGEHVVIPLGEPTEDDVALKVLVSPASPDTAEADAG